MLYHGLCTKRENKLWARHLIASGTSPPDFSAKIFLAWMKITIFSQENYSYQNKFVYASRQLSNCQPEKSIDYDFFAIRDLNVTKTCTSRQQVSESKLPLMTTDEILQNVSKFEKIRHLTGISSWKLIGDWGFMGILTLKTVFPLKSYRLPQQVCQLNYHAIVEVLRWIL